MMRMTKAVAAAALFLMPVMAQAADLPSRKKPMAAPVAAEKAYDWSGFYVGGLIGVGRSSIGFADPGHRFRYYPSHHYASSGTGVTLGLYAGVNHQFDNNLVIGLEADESRSSASSDNGYDGPPDLIRTKSNYMGSVRARMGLAVGAALVYATGGVAFGNPSSKTSNAADSDLFDNSKTHVGFAAGGGVEYRLDTKWSVRAEALYYGLGTFSNVGVPGENEGTHMDVRFHQVVGRVGLAYRF